MFAFSREIEISTVCFAQFRKTRLSNGTPRKAEAIRREERDPCNPGLLPLQRLRCFTPFCCRFSWRDFSLLPFTPRLVALTAGCRNLLRWFGKRVSHFPRNGPAIFSKVRREEGEEGRENGKSS